MPQNTTMPLTISYSPVGLGQFRVWMQFQQSLKALDKLGLADNYYMYSLLSLSPALSLSLLLPSLSLSPPPPPPPPLPPLSVLPLSLSPSLLSLFSPFLFTCTCIGLSCHLLFFLSLLLFQSLFASFFVGFPEKEVDTVKELLFGNLYLLMLTFFVASFHVCIINCYCYVL